MVDIVADDVRAASISCGDVSAKHLLGTMEEVGDLLGEGQAIRAFRFPVIHDCLPRSLGVNRVPSLGLIDGCISDLGSST